MDAAIIALHGERVGQLSRLSEDYDFRFDFDAEYVRRSKPPTLGQFFEDRLPDPVITSGLLSWFAHLLPQGPSRELFQKWHDLDREEDDDFDLLLAIGTDLPGAVEMHRGEGDIRSRVARRPPRPRPDGVPTFGLAGAQNKLSVRQGARGLVIPTWGEDGDFIAKFHDPEYAELPRLEHATTRWAHAAGLTCHETRLVSADTFEALPEGLPLGDGQVLLVTRFDRRANEKIHVEDFGQILDIPPGAQQYSRSYDDLGRVVRALCPNDVEEYVRRVAFMLVCGNGDAHLKNWGVIYADRRTPRLSPAYDLVATRCRIPRDNLALEFAGTKAWEAVSRERIAAFLETCHHDRPVAHQWFYETVERASESFRANARDFGFSAAEIPRLDAHIETFLSVVREEP